MVQAKPGTVDASALKPRCCNALALPTSNGLGIMKQPLSCSVLNVARLSAVVSMVTPQIVCWRRQHRRATPALPDASRHHLPQKRPFFREDQPVLFGEIEIGHAFTVGAQPRPGAFVRRQTVKENQREGDIVGALVRHPVTDQIAAASWNDAEPAFGIFLEHRPLERIELVTDENGDGHGGLRCFLAVIARSKATKQSIPPRVALWIASLRWQ